MGPLQEDPCVQQSASTEKRKISFCDNHFIGKPHRQKCYALIFVQKPTEGLESYKRLEEFYTVLGERACKTRSMLLNGQCLRGTVEIAGNLVKE
jgi:hypothetical protein